MFGALIIDGDGIWRCDGAVGCTVPGPTNICGGSDSGCFADICLGGVSMRPGGVDTSDDEPAVDGRISWPGDPD